jgi:hypothetical protein
MGAATATTGASLPNVAVTLAEMGANVMTGDVGDGERDGDGRGVRDAVGDGVRVAVGVEEEAGTGDAVKDGVEAGTAKPHMWVSPAVTRDQPL